MSIIIKGMNMPERGCDHCFMRNGNYCKRLLEGNDAEFSFVIPYAIKSERHPDCPLAEVLTPHGRLIDGDALDFSKVFGGESDFAKDIRAGANMTITVAPTVIEAEK